jgi:hypothetical protein
MGASHDRNRSYQCPKIEVMICRIPNQNSDSVLKMSQKDDPKGNVRTHLAAVHENKWTCLVKEIFILRTCSWINFSPPVAHSGPAPLADYPGSAPVPEAYDASPPNPSHIFVEGTQLGSRGVSKPRGSRIYFAFASGPMLHLDLYESSKRTVLDHTAIMSFQKRVFSSFSCLRSIIPNFALLRRYNNDTWHRCVPVYGHICRFVCADSFA